MVAARSGDAARGGYILLLLAVTLPLCRSYVTWNGWDYYNDRFSINFDSGKRFYLV